MDIKISDKLSNENSRHYAYRILKENIIELNIKPGESLMENEISSILNLSRTPVREAFIKLSEEKLLDIYPQKGTYVSLIDSDLVEQAIFARTILEKEILTLACKSFPEESLRELKKICSFQRSILSFSEESLEFYKLDNQFHKTIYIACKKNSIWEMIELLSSHYNRLRALDAISKKNLIPIVNQHEEIIDIIENKRIEKIEKIIDEHLSNHKHVKIKENFEDYFKK